MRSVLELLNSLSLGEFVSGQRLAEHLGVSRATVHNGVQQLLAWGIPVDSVRGKGYCLRQSVERLNQSVVLQQLTDSLRSRLIRLDCMDIVDSTSSEVRRSVLTRERAFAVCLAEMQTAGRGRRGRVWVSPYAANIYLSLYTRLQIPFMNSACVSLYICLAIARHISQLGVEGVQVKWPNDIYCCGKKLGGLLLEVSGVMDTELDMVIGLGLNVDMRNSFLRDEIDQPWTDMVSNCGQLVVNRSELAGQLIHSIIEATDAFQAGTHKPLPQYWNEYDMLHEREVIVRNDQSEIVGIAKGVDAYGRLCLLSDSQMQYITAGDVSVRVQPS